MTLDGFFDGDDPKTGRPRGFSQTFKRAVEALRMAHAKFALTGSVAYSVQVDPTFTRDVDFLVGIETPQELVWYAFEAAGFVVRSSGPGLVHAQDPETGIDVDLMFGIGDPEQSAIERAKPETVFRTSTPTLTPLFIVWTYLRSPHGRHHDRGGEILRRGLVDIAKLHYELNIASDYESARRLSTWIIEARTSAP